MAVEVLEQPMRQSLAVPRDQVIVLFGATGDLARRKLLPGIFHLFQAGLMPERFALVGTARSSFSTKEFVDLAHDDVCESDR
jgi:glucose-6-phosphate 1-dehydrogenase